MSFVSFSEIRMFQRCQREHSLSYTKGYRSAAPSALALRFGNLVHAGLESWWKWSPNSAIGRADTACLRMAHAVSKERNRVEAVDMLRAEELIRGYDGRWGDEPLTTIAVEEEFIAPLRSGIDIKGRIDALARDADGSVWVVEHKTTDNPNAAGYWERLRLDLQCSVYMLGARALGYEPAGILYDVITKPRIYPYIATPEDALKRKADGTVYARQREHEESLDDFRGRLVGHIATHPDTYIRRPIVRLEQDHEEALGDLRELAMHIIGARQDSKLGCWIPRNTDACFRYGSMCEFFNVCTHAADLHDPNQFTRRANG